MTDLTPRAAAPGARSTSLSVPRRRWQGLLSGLLATVLLSGLGTVVSTQTAEATPRAQAHATHVRHAKARPPQRVATNTTMAAPPAAVLSALQRAEAATGAD